MMVKFQTKLVTVLLVTTNILGIFMHVEIGNCTEKEIQKGVIELVVREKGSSQLIPARIELIGVNAHAVQVEDSLLVGGHCTFQQETWPTSLEDTRALLSKTLENPYTGAVVCYTPG